MAAGGVGAFVVFCGGGFGPGFWSEDVGEIWPGATAAADVDYFFENELLLAGR